jgi:general secretion pathway protein D
MMRRKKKTLLILILCFFAALSAQDQNIGPIPEIEIQEVEFRNAQVTDVLLSLARLGRITIIFDESVEGRTTHFFSDVTLQEAFEIVSNATGVHLDYRDGVWYASKIQVSNAVDNDTYNLLADTVRLQLIIDAISDAGETTILYDPLPTEPITLNIRSMSIDRIIAVALSKFPDYELETYDDYRYIRYIPSEGIDQSTTGNRNQIELQQDPDGNFSISKRGVRFSQVVEQLFSLVNLEYVMIKQSDSVLDRVEFANKNFDEMLQLILRLGQAEYVVQDDVYYILEVSRNDILRQYDSTVNVELEHISAESVPSLFPSGLVSNSVFSVIPETNSIVFRGTQSEIAIAIDFISTLDQPLRDLDYYRFDIINSPAEEVLALLPERLKPGQPLLIPQQNAFIVLTGEERAEDIEEFVRLVDSQANSVPIRLRYIQSEQLLENLPPSVTEENITQTANPTIVFFKGSPAQHDQFIRELRQIDRPVPQIRYQLLVIQFQNGARTRYELTASNNKSADGATPADSSFIGFLGNILQLNFDIVSNFGYGFAVDLNYDIGESQARILADTTLTGISGEEIDFQNTNTFRYRDQEIDPETGETASTGVTREIVSGLFLQVNGWASGDGMITMDISTTVSKQGSDSSGSGNPPGTSERVINTHVRTQSGEPVIIGGLVNQEADTTVNRTPGLSEIPLLGSIFTNQEQSVDDTELMIYIIPHLEYPYYEDTPPSELFTQLYNEHMDE